MEPSFLETFIINAAAEQHFANPGMPQFKEIMQKIEHTYGSVQAIPHYHELENITRPHLLVLSRREAQPQEIGPAAHFVVSAVKAFVKQHDL